MGKETLLHQFITSRANAYKGPLLRVEKAKYGQYPWEKYLATLLSLTNRPLREIAKWANVSYGLLAKWRTEPRFRQLVKQHRQEFVRVLLDHLKRKDEEYHDNLNAALMEKPLEEIKNISSSQLHPGYDEFADAGSYDRFLVLHIVSAYFEFANKFKKVMQGDDVEAIDEYRALLQEFPYVFDLILSRTLSKSRKQKETESMLEQSEVLKKARVALALNLAVNFLSDKKFDEKNRRMLIFVLSQELKAMDNDVKAYEKKIENRNSDE